MVDTHCHLNFHAFKDDLDEVIKSALEKGVSKIINVGTKIDSSQKAIEIAEKYENIYATVGIHPHHADKLEENWLDELEKLAKHPKIVAIGECGLDFYRYELNGLTDPKIQKELFIKQIDLSHKLKLPLMIHNRQAGWDILEIINKHKGLLLDPPGMFHCFSGDMGLLKEVLDLGFYIGFDGNITYKGIAPREITDLKDLAKATPVDRILVETDSPFLTPIPHRGEKNKPEYAIIIAKFIAELKGLEFEKFNEITAKNAEILFKLDAKR